jgi:hypothetical protein
MFALQSGGATSDKIVLPANTRLDSLAVLTVLMWVTPTSVTSSSRELVCKNTPALGGWFLRQRDTANGDFRLSCGRATSALNVTSNSGVLVNNRLTFLGGQYDINAAAAAQVLFLGDLEIPASPLTSYAAQTAGSGARSNDSAFQLILLNRLTTGVVPFPGLSWCIGLWNATLTLPEVREFQYDYFAPVRTSALLGKWRTGSHGTGPVVDDSGNGIHGVLTTAIPTSDYLPRVFQQRAS